jgi:uncharacterized membrane protein YidH (DUF202 family)
MDQQTVRDVIEPLESGPNHFNRRSKGAPDMRGAVSVDVIPTGRRISQTKVAIIVFILGVLSLAYGLFEKLQVARAMESAPVHMGLGSPWFLNLPLMFGGAAIFAGVCLLIFRVRS